LLSSHTRISMSQVLSLFDDQPVAVRAFVRARHLLCPMMAIERRVPPAGRILELGCGHGLFSALMAAASPDRSVLGVDPSAAKIRVASGLTSRLPNVRFMQGTVDDVVEAGLDAVAIVDVLYLLAPEEKERVLRQLLGLLAPGGRLVLKTNDTHPAWKYRWAKLQEQVMTGLGLTMGHGGLHFFSCAQTVALLRRVGFREVQVAHLPTLLPYPHTLFTGLR